MTDKGCSVARMSSNLTHVIEAETVSTAEAAEILGVHYITLIRRLGDEPGYLGAFKHKNAWRFPTSKLDAHVAQVVSAASA